MNISPEEGEKLDVPLISLLEYASDIVLLKNIEKSMHKTHSSSKKSGLAS